MTGVGRDVGFNTSTRTAHEPGNSKARPVVPKPCSPKALPRRIRALAVLSRFDLPLVAGDAPHNVREVCPGWVLHGALPTSPATLRQVARFLAERSTSECPGRVRALARPAAAFGTPPPR